MGRSGATLSFYDWPLITAALKAARFLRDTSWKRAHTAKWTYLSVLSKSFTRFDGTHSSGRFGSRYDRPAVWWYEKSLGKCRSRPAITDGVGLRESADKAAARRVRVALTTCCQFMLCDKLSLFRPRLRRITSAESYVVEVYDSKLFRVMIKRENLGNRVIFRIMIALNLYLEFLVFLYRVWTLFGIVTLYKSGNVSVCNRNVTYSIWWLHRNGAGDAVEYLLGGITWNRSQRLY